MEDEKPEKLVIAISGESARKMEEACKTLKLSKGSVIRQALELFYQEKKIK